MKAPAVLAVILLVTPGLVPAESPSTSLRVSAVIPPRPCDADRRCEQASTPLPAAVTRVIVSGEKVRYVGSMPTIIEKDEVKTILL